MGRYKKGLKTKNKIIQASKSLFYFNGYKKTTVQGIADLADVNLGLISYYFKSKDNIAKSIFIGFLKEIEQEVKALDCSKDKDLMSVYMAKERIFFEIILKNDNYQRFYKEIINSNMIFNLLEDYVERNYTVINNHIKKINNDDLIKSFSALEIGGRYNILRKYFRNSINLDIDMLINILIGCTPRLFGYSNENVDSYIKESKVIADKVDKRNLKLLI
jgi:DNA-binding transcriptional regulator YbjK